MGGPMMQTKPVMPARHGRGTSQPLDGCSLADTWTLPSLHDSAAAEPTTPQSIAFVHALFSALCGRAARESEAAFLAGWVESGRRRDVVRYVLSGDECVGRTVCALHRRYLGYNATDDAIGRWSLALHGGRVLDKIIADIVAQDRLAPPREAVARSGDLD